MKLRSLARRSPPAVQAQGWGVGGTPVLADFSKATTKDRIQWNTFNILKEITANIEIYTQPKYPLRMIVKLGHFQTKTERIHHQ